MFRNASILFASFLIVSLNLFLTASLGAQQSGKYVWTTVTSSSTSTSIAVQNSTSSSSTSTTSSTLSPGSLAKTISTALMIIDLDNKNGMISGHHGNAFTLTQLQENGFSVPRLLVGPGFLLGKSEQEIERMVPMVVSGRADRILIGQYKLIESEDRAGIGHFVQIETKVTLFEVEGIKKLATVSQTVQATAPTFKAAQTLALKEAANQTVQQLLAQLP